MNKPKVLFIFARRGSDTSTRFGGFAKRIAKNGGLAYATTDYVALEDLIFHIKDGETARVFDPIRNIDLAKYSFVYFKSWQSMPRLAASAAIYLEAQGIPYEDAQVRYELIAKTPNYMKMWQQGISVPESIWGSNESMASYVASHQLSYPVVIKSVTGEKGKDNYLANDAAEAVDILRATQSEMVLQPFIANDGDYRIGVYGNKARWALYRRSGGASHLNNTSSGGVAELLDIATVPEPVKQLAERAAAACELAISGVDVMEDSVTGKLYILEANQGSQIVTGAYTESNMRAFDEGLKALVQKRFAAHTDTRRPVIGRTVSAVIMPDENSTIKLVAKVDTGAYQSSMHAENIVKGSDSDGEFVSYDIIDSKSHRRLTIIARTFWRATVRNSFGVEEERFVVPMNIAILGREYQTRVSLTDRSLQKYQLLLGRKLLRGNFLINVELSDSKG